MTRPTPRLALHAPGLLLLLALFAPPAPASPSSAPPTSAPLVAARAGVPGVLPAARAPAAPVRQHVLDNGTWQVTANDLGVLVAIPSQGLTTVDGRPVPLVAPFSESWAVSYRVGGETVEAVAEGSAPDWKGRDPVEPLEVSADGRSLVATTRAGPLRLEALLEFTGNGVFLLAGVRATNQGEVPVEGVVVSREWHLPGRHGWTFPNRSKVVFDIPDDILRQRWKLGSLAPGQSNAKGFAYQLPPAPTEDTAEGTAFDVPLSFWTSPAFPDGFLLGETNGVSWGDFDRDGWQDLFVGQSAHLWRNLGGSDWEFVLDVDDSDPAVPFAERRYSGHFGDVDRDGYPEIALAARNAGVGGDNCFRLFQNPGPGGGPWLDVASDPTVLLGPQPCAIDCETICFGDVDGDAWLDAFLPIYPSWAVLGDGPGNYFLFNQGTDTATGEQAFLSVNGGFGTANPPPDSSRPEGAQFCDIDGDGDLDLFSNGTLYQNRSRLGAPSFIALGEPDSGILYSDVLEEGARFADYDMDGDFDLITAYTGIDWGIRIWENRGDGSFLEAETTLVENHTVGLGVGLSLADWDNDGDLDMTTRQIYRRNTVVDSAQVGFVLATKDIDPEHIMTATPAYADWDRDGDLDCAIGNWFFSGYFYENILYDETTQESDKHYLRVRLMDDMTGLPGGVETAFGAVVDVDVHGETSLVRRGFPASGAGYINQDEYPLHFGLPEPSGAEPVHVGLTADWPSAPELGAWRIDKHVNPVLADIVPAQLADREVTIWRSGKVTLDGVDHLPASSQASPYMTTTGGAHVVPDAGAPLAPPTPIGNPNRWTGLEFTTRNTPVRLKEIVLDGQLRPAVTCGTEPFNMLLWDVTDPGNPTPVVGGLIDGVTSPRNHRTSFRTDMRLSPNRTYRLVAKVAAARLSPLTFGANRGLVVVGGGFFFLDSGGCQGAGAVAAQLDPTQAALGVRLSPEAAGPWLDLGLGKAGFGGVKPRLSGTGTLQGGSQAVITLEAASSNAPAAIFIGLSRLYAPFLGGILVPAPNSFLPGLLTDASGKLTIPLTVPTTITSGLTVVFQVWVSDASAVQGWSSSNGLQGTVP